MAFSTAGWQAGVAHLAGRLRQHHYATADVQSVVIASGYFNSVTKQLQQGDIITLSENTGGTPTTNQVIVTSATAAATVTTAVIA